MERWIDSATAQPALRPRCILLPNLPPWCLSQFNGHKCQAMQASNLRLHAYAAIFDCLKIARCASTILHARAREVFPTHLKGLTTYLNAATSRLKSFERFSPGNWTVNWRLFLGLTAVNATIVAAVGPCARRALSWLAWARGCHYRRWCPVCLPISGAPCDLWGPISIHNVRPTERCSRRTQAHLRNCQDFVPGRGSCG